MIYDVHTDLDPEALNELGLELFHRWLDFAMGGVSIGSRMLKHPTGRYASAISFHETGQARVAIIADENLAPEAAWIEEGHSSIDMKKYLARGRAYPMHRGAAGQYGGAGYGAPSLAVNGRGPSMWAAARQQGFSGFAAISPNATTGWIIPAMPAYSPAKHLADLARSMAEG